jgi:uncharacterized protein (DUF1778 family)
MVQRERPVVVSTRVTARERALIAALAEAEGKTVSDMLNRLIMPAVCSRLAEVAREGAGS